MAVHELSAARHRMCGQLRDLDSIFKPKIADVAPGVLSSLQDLGASLVYYSTFTHCSSLISRCTAQSCFSRYADGKIRSRQIIRKMTFPICQFFVAEKLPNPTLTFSPPRSATGTLGLPTRELAGSFLTGVPLMV